MMASAPSAFDMLLEPVGGNRESSSNEMKSQQVYVLSTPSATPDVTPAPASPTSFTSSPNMVIHKGQGSHLLEKASQSNVAKPHKCKEEDGISVKGVVKGNESVPKLAEDVSGCAKISNVNSDNDDKLKSGSLCGNILSPLSSRKPLATDSEKDSEYDDFFDTRESLSIASNGDSDHSGAPRGSWRHSLPNAQYFNAYGELSNGAAFFSAPADVESELQKARVKLLNEIVQRKRAEEMLSNMQKQWERIAQRLADVGLSLPPASTQFVSAVDKDEKKTDVTDPWEDLCKQVAVPRLLAESAGRVSVLTEVGLELNSQIAAKNSEISRLCDKVRYYEAVNIEMSHRNHEAAEGKKQRRERRKRRQIWCWSAIGVAVGLSSAALAWSSKFSAASGSLSSAPP